MIEKLFAAVVLLICIGMGIHMALPLRWRARLLVWARDPLGRHARAQAAAHTRDAIQRARRPPSGRWKGNVYKLGKPGARDDRDDGSDKDNDDDQRTLH
ncbi:MAG TPA: hypothetical protein VGM81_00635 [Burkholderiaceae bacterium]